MKHAHSTTQCTPTNSHVGSESWGQPPVWGPPGSAVEPLQTPGLPVIVGSRPPAPSLSQAAESKITIGTRGGGPECTRDSESLQLAVFWEIIAGCVQRKTSLPHTQPVSLGKRTRSFTGTLPLQVLPAPGTPRAALSSLPLRSCIVSGVPCPWPCRLLWARALSVAWAVVPLAAEQAALCVRPPAGEESGGFQGGATVNKPLKFQVTLSLTSLE